MEKLPGEEAGILEALMVVAERDRIYVHLFCQGSVFHLWMLSVPGSICWKTVTRCYKDCSMLFKPGRGFWRYSDEQSSGINCIIPWTLVLAPDLGNPFDLPVHGCKSVVQSASLELLVPFQIQVGAISWKSLIWFHILGISVIRWVF